MHSGEAKTGIDFKEGSKYSRTRELEYCCFDQGSQVCLLEVLNQGSEIAVKRRADMCALM